MCGCARDGLAGDAILPAGCCRMTHEGVRFRFGDWQVEPDLNRIRRGAIQHRLEPRAMAVLVCLLRRPGEVVTMAELLEDVWPDRTVEQNAVQQRISRLRSLLGDDARLARFIETISRKGYRTVAEVERVEAGVAVATEARVRLVVLPFRETGDDADSAHIRERIGDDLRTRLVRTSGLAVIVPRSAADFDALGMGDEATMERMGVSHVVSGRLHAGVDLGVELVEAGTREVLWAGRFDCSGDALASVGRRIAHALLAALGIDIAATHGARVVDAAAIGQRPARSDLPRIAVMPFRRINEAPETAAIAAGLEEAIPALLNGPEMKPLRRRDPQTHRGFDIVPNHALIGASSDPKIVLGETGAEYALSGAVQTAGRQARISLSLTFAEAQRVVWSHSYDCASDDLLAVQAEVAMHAASRLVREVALLRYEWQVRGAMSEDAFVHLCSARRLRYGSQLGDYVRPEELLQHWQAFDSRVCGADNVAEFTSLTSLEAAAYDACFARIVPHEQVADFEALTRRLEAVATREGIHPFWNDFSRIGQAMNALIQLDLVRFERYLAQAGPDGLYRGVPDLYYALLTGDLVGVRDAAERERNYLAYRSALTALGQVELGLAVCDEALSVLVRGHGRARVLAQQAILLAMAGREHEARALAERAFAAHGGAHPYAFVTMFVALGDAERGRAAMAEARNNGYVDRMQIGEHVQALAALGEVEALHALIDRAIETRHVVGLGTIMILAHPENRLVRFIPGLEARTRDPRWIERVARVRAIVNEALEGAPEPPRAVAYKGVP